MSRTSIFAVTALALLLFSARGMSFELDDGELVHLDAEALAETGIGEAYDALLPKLRKYLPAPLRVEEAIDSDVPSYAVTAGGTDYPVYSPELDHREGRTWGRATYIFFQIVNAQLSRSTHRFYAFYGGNDLSGMFLTPAEAARAEGALARKSDWPYLPTMEHPWYGQAH